MEVEKSLYGTLCNFFSLVSSNKNIQEGKTKKTTHFVGTEIEFETEKRNRAKSNAFKTLFSVHVNEEQESNHEHQLYEHVYNLKTSGLATQAAALEIAIRELEKNGHLDTAFPVIKLLLNINPLKQEKHQQLKKIEPESTNHQSPTSDILKSDWHLFPMFEERVFQAPKIDYNKEEPYSLGVKEKLNSTWWIDRLDSAHCHLFGALSNPPKSLDRLGVTSQSLLTLGLKSNIQFIERANNGTLHSRAEKDEGYESPSLAVTSPLPQVAAINYWEDLENLCKPTRIRRTWEAKMVGDPLPIKELPYLTRAPLSVMEPLCHQLEENLVMVDNTLPRRKFIKIGESELKKHLLYLTLGIESELFSCLPNGRFQINDTPIIDGTSPDCLAEMLEPILECGNLIRQLNAAQWDPAAGKVHDALVDQVHASLQYHQQILQDVMGARSTSLIDIVGQVELILPTIRLMGTLWNWAGWGRHHKNQETPGRGVAFLQHVVHLATGTIDAQERRLLTAYFAACARPFLAYLERWLYRGQCCDPQKEFLIRADFERLNQRDRFYWTQGFSLEPINRDDSGPIVGSNIEDDALLGLMSDVYLCGKTVHLLQLCQAKEEDHVEPVLRIGLSLDELNGIRKDCEQYALNSPPEVDFSQPVLSLGKMARAVREAKLAELIAKSKAKQSDRAVERTARHAVAKAELDEQLGLKRAETKRKEERDRLADIEIEEYHEMIAQRDAKDKQRLLLKYARLLGDSDPLVNIDDPKSMLEEPEDQTNANTKNKDEENNLIIPVLPASTTSTSDPVIEQPSIGNKKSATNTGTTKKRVKPTLTREEIRTKVLREEFGIDPRYTIEKEPTLGDFEPSTGPTETFRIQEWIGPASESYPAHFNFDKLETVELLPQGKKKEQVIQQDWLQTAKPCEEEIRDLSLSFFVQRSLLLPVRTQCQIVNRSLMKLLTGPEHRFMQHLEALRCYLFLDDGAFGHSLVSNIGQRLGQLKHVHQLINIPSMNFILQSALHSVRADEYYASRLSFYIKEAAAAAVPTSLNHHISMEALNSFTLRYRVGWPTNLVLTEEVMDDYSQIFSFILQLRLAAWSMEDVHLNLKGCVRQQWHSIHLARHSVYHFVQTLQSYVMNQLLTLSWQELLTELKKRARSLDDLYEVHSSYIRRAKSRLLLNPKSAALIKIIRDVLGLALKFRSLLVASDYVYTPVLQSQVKALSTKFREYAKFLRLVLEKVNDRHQHSHLNELLIKLNFNDYYGSQ